MPSNYRALVEMRDKRARLLGELAVLDQLIENVTDELLQGVQSNYIHQVREEYTIDLLTYLTQLRDAKGKPSARTIAHGTNNFISHTTVSQVFNGSRSASWKTVKTLGQYLGADPIVLVELWRQYATTRMHSELRRSEPNE